MPTIKQRKAAKNVVENGGIISRAMIDAGYSEKTAKTPQKLTESKGWEELMNEFLPDRLLARKHQALLNKTDKETGDIDSNAVSKGLDMGYKLKGKYAPEKSVSMNVNINPQDPKAKALAEEYELKLKEGL